MVLLTSQGLTLILGGVVGGFFGVLLIARGTRPENLMTALMGDPWFLIVSALVSQSAMGLSLWKLPGLLKDAAPSLSERLRWSDEPPRWVLVPLLLVGTLCIGPLTVGVLDVAGFPKSGMLELFSKASQQSLVSFAGLVLVGAVMPGVLEELLFRGYVQTRFVERWGTVKGIVFTAALFGLWHMDVRQGLFAFGVGCFLGWGAHRAGSVVPGAMAHLLNNLISFGLSRAFAGEEDTASALPAVIVGAAVVLAGAVWSLRALTPAQRIAHPR
ncbi:MAG: type II CAAX endopeptidase family protein [Myxococcaceae bacterium]|nr:type II CAAX endopeptidase family protein [Myxococcaceae bacterium]